MKRLATLLIVVVTTAASGQDKHSIRHLEKSDFDEIHASVFIDDNCPGMEESYENHRRRTAVRKGNTERHLGLQ